MIQSFKSERVINIHSDLRFVTGVFLAYSKQLEKTLFTLLATN